MKRLILNVAVCILRLVYAPLRLCKVKNKISYMSRQSDQISEDFRLILSAMESQYPQIENVVLARKITGGQKKVWTYPFHMLRQMYHLATSKVVVIDGYCIVACLLPHKSETKVIQLWHAAAAIKKFGYQTIGKPSGSGKMVAEVMRMHKNYDYVLASSEATGKHYCEAFGVAPDKIKLVGMPHFSKLFTFEKNADMEVRYPELKEKKNILYIPTFRKGKQVQLRELVDGIDFEKNNLIARLHPLDQIDEQDERVIFDTEFTVYDWIKKADIIIADYSSLVMECAVLKKQLYFFLYDIEEYINDPGINIDFRKEGLGEFVFTKGCELREILQKKYNDELMHNFTEKYVEIHPENSLDACVRFIVECMGIK